MQQPSNASAVATQGATVPVFPYFWHPSDPTPDRQLAWERRTAEIVSATGQVVFLQEGVSFPSTWSQTATNIVASKYFRLIDAVRESSVWDMIVRVAGTIAAWGEADGYLSEEGREQFFYELAHLLVNQMAAFNSPVWFNVGVPGSSNQSSACFLLAVDDSMASITQWYADESIIFKGGSGAGVNISKLRAENEPLSLGGKASGPLSWMKVADVSAGAIKSGGVTRRAAKMVCMDCDHPDIEKFIWAKIHEEAKARVLMQAGYGRDIDGEAYASVAYQNANHSVRVPDPFMRAVEEGEAWALKLRTTGGLAKYVQARQLFRQIAEAAWTAGDPGMMFQTTTNLWHTCPMSGGISTSNPCGEYVFLDNTACNLASLNLLKFLTPGGKFDFESFGAAIDTMILAQEILVSRSNYPTEKITAMSEQYRTLGLGFANLGALLMARGLAYDSDEGRDLAAAITSYMTARAYLRSSEMAGCLRPFSGFAKNREAMLSVMSAHSMACSNARFSPVAPSRRDEDLWDAADTLWQEVVVSGARQGFRNAQVTLLAPTGTISFMMDCTTTGVEPDVALVAYKKLVGGGTLKLVNDQVSRALTSLGYDTPDICTLLEAVEAGGAIQDHHLLLPSDRAVFDCAFPAVPGGRSIAWRGHVRMVAALQPFLSGAISKTINLPQTATVEDVEDAFMLAWKLGCKSIAIYRDGCKETQVLTTTPQAPVAVLEQPGPPVRRRLPDERQALTHKFAIGGVHEGYLTVGLYEDGQPGEIFLKMAKEGSTLSGFADGFAVMVSLALQYGVPLEALIAKFSYAHFEPAGWTAHPDVRFAHSILDYVFRYLQAKFIGSALQSTEPMPMSAPVAVPDSPPGGFFLQKGVDTPPCWQCGSLMLRNGSCLVCPQCGANTGCSG